MYCTRKINADYTWVGADCRRLALFEGVFGVPDGVSFNSYLLTDEKTVLFDTVDNAVRTTFRENVTHALAGRTPVILCSEPADTPHTDVLVNLSGRTPPFFSRFERMVEVVTPDEPDRAGARERWRFYCDRGYPLESHDLTA